MALSNTFIDIGNATIVDTCRFNQNCVIRVIDQSGINITINTIDGRKLVFVVSSNDSIINVKKMIQDRLRFDEDKHRLSLNGTILEDHKTIGSYSIGKGCIIDVVARPRRPTKLTSSLVFSDEECYSSDNDDDIVDDCGFNENCVIRVIDQSGINIILNTLDGRNVEFIVFKNDKIIKVMKKIRDRVRFDKVEHRLSFKGTILEDNKDIGYYNIEKGSCIKMELRTKKIENIDTTIIDGKTNKSRPLLNLKSLSKGFVYKNSLFNRGIQHFQLNAGKVYPWSKNRIRILIHTIDMKTVSFDVSKTDKIIDLKKMIHGKISQSTDEHKLEYQGEILDDDKTINYYNIVDNSVIKVVYPMKGGNDSVWITIGDDGDILEYKLLSNDNTIIDIRKWLQDETGLFLNEQCLKYDEEILVDEKRIIEDGNINFPRGIQLDDAPRSISARVNQGESFLLNVKLMNSIIDIKKMIQEQTGLSTDKQIFKLSGNVLIDHKKVYEYKIITNSNIDICEASNITIILSIETIVNNEFKAKMETIPLEIMNNLKIKDLREKIASEIKRSCDDRLLIFKNQILNDEDIVASYNICDKNDVQMNEEGARGICVIISNETFTRGWSDRSSTATDENDIKTTFHNIGYEIKVFKQVTRIGMKKIIEDIKKDVEETHRKIIFFVLTHCKKKGIFMSDGGKMSLEDICNPFYDEQLSQSKIFFFSGYLGSNMKNVVRGISKWTIQDDTSPHIINLLGFKNEIFVGYAGYEFFVSHNDPTSGNLYIMCLCQVVRNKKKWTLYEINLEVQKIFLEKLSDAIPKNIIRNEISL